MEKVSKRKLDEAVLKDLDGDNDIKVQFDFDERRKKEGVVQFVMPCGKTVRIDKTTLLAFCLTISPENLLGDFFLGKEQLVYQFWSQQKIKLEKDMKAGEVITAKVPFRITKELFTRLSEVATEKDGILTPNNPFDKE